MDKRTITIDGFASFEVVPSTQDESDFWSSLADGSWEANTVAAIRLLAGPGVVFWDIGAWIGPTALLALARGAEVVAFEPDPVAWESLSANLAANAKFSRNVVAVNAAVSSSDGGGVLRTQTALGDSMSSLTGRGAEGPNVEIYSFLRAIEAFGLPARSVVKIDIEGGEFLLGGAVWGELGRADSTIVLSTHPTILAPWYRVSKMKRLNRLLAVVKSFVPMVKIFYPLRNMKFYGDYSAAVGWQKLGFFSTLGQVFGGKNQVFVVSSFEWE